MTDPKIHKTYTAIPGFKFGMISPDKLEELAAIARKYEVPMLKVTGAQRISFLGIEPERLKEFKSEFNLPDKPPHARNKVHHVQACPGEKWCKFGQQETMAMAEAIDALVLKGPLPYKVKVGISGCRMCCCESWVRDVGLVGGKNGWRFIFGGNAAGKPRIGDIVAENLSKDEAVQLVEKCLNFFIDTAKFKTRSARFMERFGIEELKKGILD